MRNAGHRPASWKQPRAAGVVRARRAGGHRADRRCWPRSPRKTWPDIGNPVDRGQGGARPVRCSPTAASRRCRRRHASTLARRRCRPADRAAEVEIADRDDVPPLVMLKPARPRSKPRRRVKPAAAQRRRPKPAAKTRPADARRQPACRDKPPPSRRRRARRRPARRATPARATPARQPQRAAAAAAARRARKPLPPPRRPRPSRPRSTATLHYCQQSSCTPAATPPNAPRSKRRNAAPARSVASERSRSGAESHGLARACRISLGAAGFLGYTVYKHSISTRKSGSPP